MFRMKDSAKSAQSPMQSTALDKLRGEDATRWPNITAAKSLSRDKMAALTQIVGDLLPTDEGSLVVFGSLARSEFTVESDLDWMIMIDARADSGHLKIVHALKSRLKEGGFKVPGPTDVFGGLVFSHELIHAIGGDEDTNKNMTRRLLLLLESAAVGSSGSKQVRSRIINGILNRYLEEDANFITANNGKKKIPRFLLNDVVRFWRTMAVDYVNKYRARAGDKWALRNIKLRMSRKLLFVSGFFMCISWALNDPESGEEQFTVQKLVSHLRDWTERPPLESLATIVERYAPSLASDVFDAYDSFLALLNNEDMRKVLEQLTPEEAYNHRVFLDARQVAHRFDDALLKLMFESNDEITEAVKKYGVF
jgi:predicted nucleotidyltransferase